ncbi:CKLF-like MARVEL transmembrane domain-containing protein 4 [Anneissia japonica]|uniref:CKLF-like MARVEL transmembrane domain-containing protein 4 n=1 Tax=Anneissia japonica TaxID=1529436 RepID=UPI0014258D5F|nr:CKLF-like MARVEL transmembrane domain-containing protein 4 [Anneissia japonica]
MDKSEFPDTVQTTTTTTSTAYHATTTSNQGSGPGNSGGIRVDQAYLRSLPSILHIVQIVVSFLYWVVLCAVEHFRVGFMIFVGITAMITVIVYFVVFLLRLNEKIPFIAWELSELIANFVSAALFFISAIITSVRAGQANHYPDHGKLVFCSLLAWTLTFLFAASTFLSFRAFLAYRDRRNSERTATTTTTTTITQESSEPPPY